jgi:hypothetical protein
VAPCLQHGVVVPKPFAAGGNRPYLELWVIAGGRQTTSLHAYHTKVETIVPIQGNVIADFDSMSHPADGEAWRTLDYFDPKFARDLRSVLLGLLTDGFQPYSTDSSPVIPQFPRSLHTCSQEVTSHIQ